MSPKSIWDRRIGQWYADTARIERRVAKQTAIFGLRTSSNGPGAGSARGSSLPSIFSATIDSLGAGGLFLESGLLPALTAAPTWPPPLVQQTNEECA